MVEEAVRCSAMRSNALAAPDLQAIRNPAQRLSGDEVVERVRYRVRQAGWQRVAEEGVVWRTQRPCRHLAGDICACA